MTRVSRSQSLGFLVLSLVLGMSAWALPAAAQAETPPVIVSESVSGLTTSDATLEATIIPGEWLPEAPLDFYQFQLVEDPSEFRPELSCPYIAPPKEEGEFRPGCSGGLLSGGSVGSYERLPSDLPTEEIIGTVPPQPQNVQLDLATVERELTPGRTYHFRVIVALAPLNVDKIKWIAPPVYGQDETFVMSTGSGLFPEPEGELLSPPSNGAAGGVFSGGANGAPASVGSQATTVPEATTLPARKHLKRHHRRGRLHRAGNATAKVAASRLVR